VKKDLFSRRLLSLSGALAALLLGLAPNTALADTTPVETSACAAHQLTQPFLSAGDANWYALAPGEATDSFVGDGWTFSGGARIVQTQLADGLTGSVVDLPTGSVAVSPAMCVTSDYSKLRAMVQNVTGDGNVAVEVSYAGTDTANQPKKVGDLHGHDNTWTASDPVDAHPSGQPGWQLVRLTLVAGGHSSDFQFYNLSLQASAALAQASVDTSACTQPQLSQPFLSAGDPNWYTLTPGETPGNFDGTGWTLSGGARIIQTQLADGRSASVLDLPSGAKAVSPTMCVTADYPKARAMVRNVLGGDSVAMSVAYGGTDTWNNAKHTGDVHGHNDKWTLSDPVAVQPGNRPGWQLVQFTLAEPSQNSEAQVYDFDVDPRMRG
jgi:hypothetical protein